jgi:L-ascorbate metabolism protein UlaG (beta-lactamase superfamily)
MDITYYGFNCFRMMERGTAAIVADPFGEELTDEVPRLRGDIVTISHDADGYNAAEIVRGDEVITLRGPGEYEIGGIFVTGIATYNPDVAPEDTHANTIYIYNFGSVTVCHLGTLDYVLKADVIEALGEIDVLMTPVGGGSALTSSQAAELISLVEPGIVIPMHYSQEDLPILLDPLDRFLKEMGVTEVEMESSLRVSSRSTPDSTQVVVLARKT